MRLLGNLTLALLWLSIIATRKHAQAGVHRGCCTSYSKVRAVNSILRRGGAVQCWRQEITELCNINAVVLKWKYRQICVDPNHRNTRKLLPSLCNRKIQKGRRKLSRLRSKNPRI